VLFKLQLVVWSLGGCFVREWDASAANVKHSIQASVVALAGTVAAQVLYTRTYYSKLLA
jgi:hypothetical protein